MADELISRKAAIEAVCKYCAFPNMNIPCDSPILSAKSCEKKRIDAVPTIEERKRGEWYLEEYPDGYYQAQCSECGFTYNEDAYNSFRFCPRCGARMEESDETD